MSEVKSKSYTLYSESGSWLGQVVITNDGMLGSVTDWGNFSYSWRSFGECFRTFLLGLNEQYFGQKLATGMAYIVYNKKVEQSCIRYAEKILPALRKALEEDLKINHEWK